MERGTIAEITPLKQDGDNNFYKDGKMLLNPQTNEPLTTEEVKLLANQKKPGTFADSISEGEFTAPIGTA